MIVCFSVWPPLFSQRKKGGSDWCKLCANTSMTLHSLPVNLETVILERLCSWPAFSKCVCSSVFDSVCQTGFWKYFVRGHLSVQVCAFCLKKIRTKHNAAASLKPAWGLWPLQCCCRTGLYYLDCGCALGSGLMEALGLPKGSGERKEFCIEELCEPQNRLWTPKLTNRLLFV